MNKKIIPLRLRNGNGPKKEGPSPGPQRFLPFPLSRFSALLARALLIASSLPGGSPGPQLLGFSISSHRNPPKVLRDGLWPLPDTHSSDNSERSLAALSLTCHSHFGIRTPGTVMALSSPCRYATVKVLLLSLQGLFSFR